MITMLDTTSYKSIFLNMIIVVFILLLLAFYLHKSDHMRSFDDNGDYDVRNAIVKIVSFGFVGVITTHFFSYDLDGYYVNTVIFVATLAGLAGGPRVGVIAGAIIGAEGILSGADPQIACAVSAVIAGVIGGMIRWMAGMKYPRISWTLIAAVCAESVQLFLLWIASPSNQEFVRDNVILMLCLAALSALIYSSIYLHYIRHKPLEW
jgi:two-component system, LytTR family, sensor histidine kinase LytS